MIIKGKKCIAVLHHLNHWSFAVIDTGAKTMRAYDSMIGGSHEEVDATLRDRCGRNKPKQRATGEWKIEQMEVSQQKDKAQLWATE